MGVLEETGPNQEQWLRTSDGFYLPVFYHGDRLVFRVEDDKNVSVAEKVADSHDVTVPVVPAAADSSTAKPTAEDNAIASAGGDDASQKKRERSNSVGNHSSKEETKSEKHQQQEK